MNNLPPPSAFTIDQNDPNKWPKWRKKFENYIIANRIVLGCRDTTLREKYLQNPDLTLALAINQGQAAEC
ncbi:hypothetical protein LAZ67_5002744 [Cordylochernes scorpioides]|uniref:Uncharacterized protein n=1 Tax=Cordylochernes scorpioides TaxID=51811 RepID=A0ABY6KLG2_9ARAC|nr:hypothetical protein LAZ67_5002744 [Cordylochernes scorpioides]